MAAWHDCLSTDIFLLLQSTVLRSCLIQGSMLIEIINFKVFNPEAVFLYLSIPRSMQGQGVSFSFACPAAAAVRPAPHDATAAAA
jgi:hypothetical protein